MKSHETLLKGDGELIKVHQILWKTPQSRWKTS